jgi:FKBP-type peptidyl-prolyl cis-trans isomerase
LGRADGFPPSLDFIYHKEHFVRKSFMKGITSTGIVLLTVFVIFTAWVLPGFASDTEKTGQQAAGPDVGPATGAQPHGEPWTPNIEMTPEVKAKTEEQKKKWSYVVGVETVRNFKRQKMDLDKDMVLKGFTDALTGAKIEVSDREIYEALFAFSGDWRTKKEIGSRLEGLDNKQAGDVFLDENKTREGVVTLPDGLQYKIIKDGKGKKPTDADIVTVNYRGTLIDGTEFINTAGYPLIAKVLDPLDFVAGLREALKLMQVGSRWQIFIPPHLAYAQRGMGDIGPNSTLIYEVELVAIN